MKNLNTKVLSITLLFLIAAGFQLCKKHTSNSSGSMDRISEYVSINGQKFLDPYGRELTLHGINVVNKNPETGYLGHISPEEMAKFKTWGFNVIRLGIIWDGLEHEPGVYNEAYLKGVDEMIQWAADNDLYVFLDMHQDLYSVEFSDGAPSWATITNDQAHETGAVWSDSYLISPAVQTAFDNFWANAPAPDGIGIQDHYLNLWKHIAKRYESNTTVIGYDIMNEPFMGSDANNVMPLLLQAYAMILVEKTGQAPPSEEELMYMWSAERLKVLETLSEKEVYRKMIDGIYDVNAAFEQGPLTAFFQKSRDAIREVDQHHIIFTEHSYFTNMGVTGALGEIVDEHGKKDPLVAYAAHGYDLVVDTEALALGSNDRVELIFERIAETGKRLDVPVLIGEWGALHGKSPELIPVADFLMSEYNKHGFSDTFWAYGKFLDEASFLNVLKKPYPVSISGNLISYSYAYEQGDFSCEWTENPDISAPSIIFIPDLDKLNKEEISIMPDAESIEIVKIDQSNAGHLIITPTGKSEKRVVTFKINKAEEQEISLVK
jgi:endoglycosylceramidase